MTVEEEDPVGWSIHFAHHVEWMSSVEVDIGLFEKKILYGFWTQSIYIPAAWLINDYIDKGELLLHSRMLRLNNINKNYR